MEFRNIAISGRIAVGSSSLAKALSLRLGWKLRDAGQIFRDVTAQMGFNLEVDINKAIGSRNDQIDMEVDRKTAEVLNEGRNSIVTSKLAGFLSKGVKNVLRVLVICPIESRFNRYAKDRGYSLADAKKLLEEREDADNKKWERLYGRQDFFDPKIFHLVVDSAKLSVAEEVKLVLRHLNLTQNLC